MVYWVVSTTPKRAGSKNISRYIKAMPLNARSRYCRDEFSYLVLYLEADPLMKNKIGASLEFSISAQCRLELTAKSEEKNNSTVSR